ncbi:hypothetical protein C0991_005156 [Blastosporella zonata]|nr:hypothetical protein C0991_005156 [Blastosporella zonata]
MVNDFLEHQKAQKIHVFWIEMEKEWNIRWLSRGRLPDTTEDPDSKLNPIQKEKQRLRNWFSNLSQKLRKQAPGKLGKFFFGKERTRLPQVTELWSRRNGNYEEKVKHLVDAKVATHNIPCNKALAVVNRHTRKVFNAQPEEVQVAMYAKLEELKNNTKATNAAKEHAPPDPKKYAAYVHSLSPSAIL